MARAPGHTSGEVKGPKTLTLIFLPARSPELNPAIEAGLTDRLWDVEDIVKLVDDAERAPKKRGP